MRKSIIVFAMCCLAVVCSRSALGGEPQPTLTTLKTKKIDFDLDEAPLTNVLRAFSKMVDIQVVLSPEIKHMQRVTLQVKDMPAILVLNWVMRMQKGLSWTIRDEVVYIAPSADGAPPKPRLRSDDPASKAIEKKLDATRVSFDFDKVPMDEAFRFFATRTKVAIIFHPDVRPAKRKLDIKGKDLTVMHTINWLVKDQQDLRWQVIDGAVYIYRYRVEKKNKRLERNTRGNRAVMKKLAKTKVSLSLKDAPLREALSILGKQLDVTFVIDPDVGAAVDSQKRTVTLTVKKMKAETALMWIIRLQQDLVWSIRDEVVFIQLKWQKPLR